MHAPRIQQHCTTGGSAISEARKHELRTLGYRVENMADEYGPSFRGQFRFINIRTADFQDCHTSTCEDSAWLAAHNHAERVGVAA